MHFLNPPLPHATPFTPLNTLLTLLLLLLLFPHLTTALSYTALGDSYAAGSGATSPHHPDIGWCGRFSGAYPVQLSLTLSLAIPPSHFTNLACGGASSLSVLRIQAAYIREDVDVVTLTVGGNEVDFFTVLNACVGRWFPAGADCEGELVRAREKVMGEEFLRGFGRMVKGVRERVREGRVLVTGYARFFDAETVQCDGVSFARGRGGVAGGERYLLTREMRRRFNAIVRALNDVVRASAQTYGVEYVDIDELFEGHRFCEEGVEEPSNTNRTWFFNHKNPVREEGDGADQQILPGPVDDYLEMTRAFHPTVMGHEAIAKKLTQIILND